MVIADIRAQGTGTVIFQEAVEVANKIVADKNVNVNNVNVTTDTTGMFRNEQIEFSNNVISTYVSNADLEITSQRNILLQESVVAKAMQLQDVTTSGAILNTADTQTLSITGNISLDSIDTGDLQIFDNNIKTKMVLIISLHRLDNNSIRVGRRFIVKFAVLLTYCFPIIYFRILSESELVFKQRFCIEKKCMGLDVLFTPFGHVWFFDLHISKCSERG